MCVLVFVMCVVLVSELLVRFVIVSMVGLVWLSVLVVSMVLVGMWMKVCMVFYSELNVGILLVRNLVMVSMVVVLIIYGDISMVSVLGRWS